MMKKSLPSTMATSRMCPNCRAFVDGGSKVCEYCGVELGAPSWKRAQAFERAAVAGSLMERLQSTTGILLLINLGLFAATMVTTIKYVPDAAGSLSIDGRVLEMFGGKFGPVIYRYGEWWRLVTAGFLHGGVFHILMNMWVITDLGAQVEQIYGTSRYLVIYLLSSIAGFALSLWWAPYSLSIGASAAACGLLGAMMAFGRRSGSDFIWKFYLRWAIMLIVIGLMPGFHIDNAAHIGGLAGGFGIGYIAYNAHIAESGESFWKGAAALCVIVTAFSMYKAYMMIAGRLFAE